MVIDTMIFTYALFGAEQEKADSKQILEKANRIIVPDSFYSEFTNSLWQWVLHKNVSKITALESLLIIEVLITQMVETKTLSRKALNLALERNHSVYDSLFVASAIEYDTKVISYDKKLLRTFPEYSIHPRVFLNKIN